MSNQTTEPAQHEECVTMEDIGSDEDEYYGEMNNNNSSLHNNNNNNNSVNNNNNIHHQNHNNNNNNNNSYEEKNKNLLFAGLAESLSRPVNIQVTAKVLFGSVSAISALNAERKKKPGVPPQ